MPALSRDRDGRQPAFGLWPCALRGALRQALTAGTRKMTDFSDRAGATWVDFPEVTPDPFFNVNTPEDLAAAEALIAHSGGSGP